MRRFIPFLVGALTAASAWAATPQTSAVLQQCQRQLAPIDCASCSGSWQTVSRCAATMLYPRTPTHIFNQCIGTVSQSAANQPMAYDRRIATLDCVAAHQFR